MLEWYDFAVFGFFSEIIGEVFFPPDQEGNSALAESFAVFGGAFVARPLGGMLMGYIGDTYGRKRALELSIFLMAFPTFAMGCLPTYAQVGPWAIVLLTITRLLQGMSVGGQLMTSAVFTVEGQPDKSKWGYYGSLVFATANTGTLLGGIVGEIIQETLTYRQLREWGWRIPFLCGVSVSFFGIYLKCFEEEDEIGGAAEGNQKKRNVNPLKEAVTTHLKSTFSVGMVCALWSTAFYIFFVWGAIYMDTLLGEIRARGDAAMRSRNAPS